MAIALLATGIPTSDVLIASGLLATNYPNKNLIQCRHGNFKLFNNTTLCQ